MNSNTRNTRRSAAVLVAMVPALSLALSVAMAQSFSVVGKTTAGGGGVSTGGSFSVSGTTAGQPDAGTAAGGSFMADGGFWTLVSLFQVTDAPPIAFRREAQALVVYWPLPDNDWLLETATELVAWTDVPPATYQTDGVSRFVRVSQPGAMRFFRLHRPPPPAGGGP